MSALSSPTQTPWHAPLLWVAMAMAGGCAWRAPGWEVPALAALALAGVAWRVRRALWAAPLWLLAVAAAGAANRSAAEEHAHRVAQQVVDLNQRPNARVEGRVERVLSDYPRVRVQVLLDTAWTAQQRTAVDARVVVTLPAALFAPKECDRLLFRASLHEPREAAFPGDLNAKASLGARGVHLQASVHHKGDAVVLGGAEQGVPTWLCQARNATRQAINAALPDDASALVQAFVLGDAPSMEPTVRGVFDAAGASHLLAVSGLQATLLASLFFTAVRWLWGRSRLLLARMDPGPAAAAITLPAVAMYAAFAGGAASVVRSAWMAGAVMFALWVRRPSALVQSLGAAAVIMLVWEPRAILDAGFQLSFLSVLSLVLLAPALQAAWPGALGRTWWAPALASSVAAWVATLPAVTLLFGRVAPWGLVSNLVLVPLGGAVLPAVVVLTLGGVALGWALPLKVAGALSMALHDVCVPFVSLPGALWELRPASSAAALASLLGLFACALQHPRARRWGAVLALGGLFSGLWDGVRLVPTLRVFMVPVGQGDCVVLQSPQGEWAVLDAGGSFISTDDPGARVVVPLLRRLGVTQLAWVALSHPHPDHMNGLVSVVQAFPVKEYWSNGQSVGAPRYQALMDALRARGALMRTFVAAAAAPAQVRWGDVVVDVLHPFAPSEDGRQRTFPELEANDNSLVLRVGYRGHHVLLPGDIEEEAEHRLAQDPLSRDWLRADLLKVPHHGSRTSSTSDLLDAVQPRHALMGVGLHNPWGFPHEDVLDRYAQRHVDVWRTDLDGLIEVRVDSGGVHVNAHLR